MKVIEMQIKEYKHSIKANYAIVHRTDELYESFPDVELTKKGTYLCTFTRATFHCGFYRTIMITRSTDGLNWEEPKVVAHPRNTKYRPWKMAKLMG